MVVIKRSGIPHWASLGLNVVHFLPIKYHTTKGDKEEKLFCQVNLDILLNTTAFFFPAGINQTLVGRTKNNSIFQQSGFL